MQNDVKKAELIKRLEKQKFIISVAFIVLLIVQFLLFNAIRYYGQNVKSIEAQSTVVKAQAQTALS